MQRNSEKLLEKLQKSDSRLKQNYGDLGLISETGGKDRVEIWRNWKPR